MGSDNQRRPTQKLGKVRRDPRADSIPPAVIEERVAERTTSGRPVPKVSSPVPARGQHSGPPHTVASLEAALAKERAARAAEAGEIGELLARATRAEARVRQLEELIAKLLDERAKLEVEVSGQRHSAAAQLLERRATLEKLAGRSTSGSKFPNASLDGVRTLATELLRELQAIEEDGVQTPRISSPPESRRRTPLSGTLPPRASKSSIPETLPPRSRQDPPSSRRNDTPPPRSRS